MIYFLQAQTLKIDAMAAFNALTLILAFLSYIIIYNKAVKNSVNKTDVDNVENKMKIYVDDKVQTKDKEIRGIYHHIQEFKSDNEKDHDRIRKEDADRLMGMAKQLDEIYTYLLNNNKK